MPTTPEIWTHSRISARQRCPMSEHLRYERKLNPIKRSMSLSVGSAIHKGLETGSIELALKNFANSFPSNQEEADDLIVAQATVEAALAGYFELYKDDNWQRRIPELKFNLPVRMPKNRVSRKHQIAGKIDDVVMDEMGNWWLIE